MRTSGRLLVPVS